MFSASKSGKVVSAGTPDPQFNYVTALLHGDGTNGAQNNTFIDSSTNAFTITRNGTPTQGSFSPYGSLWSLYTDQRSYITIPASSDFDLISTDFTIEFWLNPIAFNTMTYAGSNIGGNGMATATNGWGLGFDGSGTTVTQISYFTWSSGTVTLNSFNSLSLTLGNWYHVAIVRNGSGANNLTLYVNGVKQGSSLTASTYSTAGSTFVLGSGSYIQNTDYSGNAAYYISNFRLSKSAVYTSNFTPSTTPLTTSTSPTLLLCQSNRLINNGSNTGAITSATSSATYVRIQRFNPFLPTSSQAYSTSVYGGSGYFAGASGVYDYITSPTSSNLAIGTNNFTLEGWFYNTSVLNQAIFCQSYNSGIDVRLSESGTTLGFYMGSGTWNSASFTITNAWTHFAVVRNGSGTNNVTLYVNGQVFLQITNTTNLTANQFQCGKAVAGGATYGFNGYLSDCRFVNGTAVYTSAFTPPTSPLTAVTNTQLLLSYQNGAIYDNAMMNDWITVGGVQINTSVKKYGTGSVSFDGTTGYLLPNPPTTNLYAFGSGNFTIEMWIYPTTSSGGTRQIFYDSKPSGGSGFYVTISLYTGTNISFYTNGNDQITGGAVTFNVWSHVALVKNGSTTTLYLNGVSQGTYADSNTYLNPTQRPVIGTNGGALPSAGFYGYIDDLRVTTGYARYTANFTPPTAALPNYGR